ncbi:peripheral plasma membrane protein CASK-like [Oppia nitens]|uniref:peripheral plasma membrane protein CASK-like n=1 Tax=Oppia nitens TaxID=1686743 RepID=UPI0023DCCF54|nr:peripheral plasma membrane protein CASK-like [Oppia nitens]
MTQTLDESTIFDDKYNLDLCIKTGRFSCIYHCTDKSKGDKYLAKFIDLRSFTINDNDFINTVIVDECQRLQRMTHKQIANIYETYILSQQIVCLVYQFIEGNNLLVEIVNRANAGYIYSENVISYYMNQIMEAIDYCHKSDIIHGNIRAENILMSNNKSEGVIKLCGFGRTLIQNHFKQSCVHYYETNNLFNLLPNPYMAPELHQPNAVFTKASDIYSSGILLLTLLCGSSLHFDPQIDFFSIGEKIWNGISDITKELVLKMLKPKANSRITAHDVLNHKWLSRQRTTRFR